MTERPRQRLGAFGERVAAHHLEAAGLVIVGRNLRTVAGEIDLLARDGPDLAFIEVRTRRRSPGAAAESVAGTKLARMWRCAVLYCEAEGIDPATIRLDRVTVELDERNSAVAVEHTPGLTLD